MQIFGRNDLNSSYMFANYLLCLHLDLKTVPSLDRSPLDFPSDAVFCPKAIEPLFYKMKYYLQDFYRL